MKHGVPLIVTLTWLENIDACVKKVTHTHTHTHTHVILSAPPVIVESFPETEVFVSQPVTITCRANSNEPLSWTWRRDTQEVFTSGEIRWSGWRGWRVEREEWVVGWRGWSGWRVEREERVESGVSGEGGVGGEGGDGGVGEREKGERVE